MTYRRHLVTWLFLVFAFASVAALVGACHAGGDEGQQPAEKPVWTCPMHPTYTSDRPGDCPICSMRLVPQKKVPTVPPVEPASGTEPAPGTPGGSGPSAKLVWTCPMHPEIISDKPGDCPICGMHLERKAAASPPSGAAPAGSEAVPAGVPEPGPTGRRLLFYRSPMDPTITSPVPAKDSMGMDFVPVYADEAPKTGGVEGLAPVYIDESAVRLAHLQTALAAIETLTLPIRTVGVVEPDETRVSRVNTRVSGWIEKLFVDFNGRQVRSGEPLLSLYSPELLATQEELVRARDALDRLPETAAPEVRTGVEQLVAGARERLALFGVPKDFVQALERTGRVQREVTLTAPASGYVSGKEIFAGQQVEPGMALMTISDLSHVWLKANLYEYEASAITVGQTATLASPYDPTLTMEARVSYIQPTLDRETRTLEVRFDLDNRSTVLKPGMYLDVSLEVNAGEGVVVPDSAVMDTGSRQVVYVLTGPGAYEPRGVKVGARTNGKALVLAGVEAGEQVVVRGNFLLDSESRLRAALAANIP